MTTTSTKLTPGEQRTEHPHVTRIKGLLGGVPIVRGTRIPVRLVAQMYRAGDSVDDILTSYPQLDPATVHDAISYYLDHREEIEQEIAAHRIENVLPDTGAQMSQRGWITFPPDRDNG